MQNAVLQLERDVPYGGQENVFFLDNKHSLYRRMERWIRLQQFVFGLPDDFSYSVHLSERAGVSTCRSLVRVGWMSWYGEGRATDRQQALALALLETSDAISANAYKVFFYSLSKWMGVCWQRVWRKRALRTEIAEEVREKELLAG